MTYSYLPGDWEGFMMGQPEFETYVFVKHPAASVASQYRCVGAQGSPYYYDQNGAIWSGSVELVTNASMTAFMQDNSGLVMFVWEDDAEDCTIKTDHSWFNAAYQSLVTLLGFGFVAVAAEDPDNCEWECIVFIVNLALAPFDIFTSVHEDDFVGELVPSTLTGSCSDVNHMIVGPNGSFRGCVQINGIGILPPPPPPEPALTASIDGPSIITTKANYTWTAVRSGGPGAYTYQWEITYLNGGYNYTHGTSQSQSLMVYPGDGEFDLSVRVTSGGSTTVVAILHVRECIVTPCQYQ